MLAIELRDHPELAGQLKVIDTLGPSSIQPVVIAAGAPSSLKRAIRDALLAMADDEEGRAGLAHGMVERFVAVSDGDYDDIRAMLEAASGELHDLALTKGRIYRRSPSRCPHLTPDFEVKPMPATM